MNHVQNHSVWLGTITALFALLFHSTLFAGDNEELSMWKALKRDVCNFSDGHRLLRMGWVFGGCGIIANTSLDQNFQNWYQGHTRSAGSDEGAKVAKVFGEGRYLVPVSLMAAAMGCVFRSSEALSQIGYWGQMTARAYLMGGPAVLCMQRLTGGSRPGENEHGSRWDPWKDDNGVSGHAFIGAVPFLTIAHLNEDRRPIRCLFYVLSGFTAWSRINDDRHFASQAILGWYVAWEATDAVFDGENKEENMTISPLIGHDRYGISVDLVW